MTTLRSKVIRLAASMPKGDPKRRLLLAAIIPTRKYHEAIVDGMVYALEEKYAEKVNVNVLKAWKSHTFEGFIRFRDLLKDRNFWELAAENQTVFPYSQKGRDMQEWVWNNGGEQLLAHLVKKNLKEFKEGYEEWVNGSTKDELEDKLRKLQDLNRMDTVWDWESANQLEDLDFFLKPNGIDWAFGVYQPDEPEEYVMTEEDWRYNQWEDEMRGN